MPVPERLGHVKQNNLCINCFKKGHLAASCTMRGCLKCNRKHNTLLHLSNNIAVQSPSTSSIQVRESNTIVPVTNMAGSMNAATESTQISNYVFLATAIVKLVDEHGNVVECRALLDSGSQRNFITERLLKRLKLSKTDDIENIVGIGNQTTKIRGRVNVQLQSKLSAFSTNIEAFIIKTITTQQPGCYIDVSSWNIPRNIQLADPAFNQPKHIDLLVGADIYCQLMSVGQIKIDDNLPTIQNTVFGWVMLGKAATASSNTVFCGVTNVELDEQMQRFWELEELPELKKQLTEEQQITESFFESTTTRNDSGRFVVKLPFSSPKSSLGDSKEIAMQRFFSVEKRLQRNSSLRIEYTKFMREYENLGHMEEISEEMIPKFHYFLPHHCVIKPSSTSTKLRVVFDAAATTSNNISLNKILHKGPTVQDDLFSILLRFRLHSYVCTADIEKMYRQILVHDDDTYHQLILWREAPTQPLKFFRLKTVTYGTTCAPYLATKCLNYLAELEHEKYPLGAKVTQEAFYVDDVMFGSNSLKETLEIQDQLRKLMKTGGFVLRKWTANNPKLLQKIDHMDREEQVIIDGCEEGSVKTLGLTWLPISDSFIVKTKWPEQKRITKRTVLSDITHLFDPLGFVNPVITLAKIFMQELWKLKLDWDAVLPLDYHYKWTRFRKELSKLDKLMICRHAVIHDCVNLELHAFADASEKAYGTAIYLRSKNKEGIIKVQLLCAKSKVAPLKTVNLPRLELCAAKMAAKLVNRLKEILKIQIDEWHYWSDSMLTLSWIRSDSTYKSFVANRVAYIKRTTETFQWHHISSNLNPADLVSRGVFPEQLLSSPIWLNGPMFLSLPKSEWPNSEIVLKEDKTELKQVKSVLLATNKEQILVELINHNNNFKRLQEVMAYIIRFTANSRCNKNERVLSYKPTQLELDKALTVIIKHMQQQQFSEDIIHLKKYKCVHKKSKLSTLTPFIDAEGLLRVGGRLQNSNMSYDVKHPMLIPGSHHFSRLLLESLHRSNFHAGPQALLAITRQRFWPTRGKELAQTIVQQCIRCVRSRPKTFQQIMGNLPSERIQPARPFLNVGVDFCGPFEIHYKLRGKRPTKAYVAVFVCFAVKAVHLEIVSDLTTESFIAALKRFVARRGRPAKIFSDNATNFSGAKTELRELHELFLSQQTQNQVTDECSKIGIDWLQIPPRSPHFGGLWEAAVKTAKYHMVRVTKYQSLTYEELLTVITEIEAVMNSRPLTPLTSDPNDMETITPGHFLIGEPLPAIVDPKSKETNMGLLRRWKLVQQIRHVFWDQWSTRYLQELQVKYRWKESKPDVLIGMLVMIKDSNLPPLKWKLGRIIKAYVGGDGHTRAVDVKTQSGVLKRSIHVLAPLPVNNDIQINLKLQKESEDNSTTSASCPQEVKRKTTEDIRGKRKRISRVALLSTMIIAIILMPVRAVNVLEIEPLSNAPGLYFEKTEQIYSVVNKWNLVLYYKLDSYWNEVEELKKSIDQMNGLCDVIRYQKQNCKNTVEQFLHVTESIDRYNEVLRARNGARKRRSPFNFVGRVSNLLFGVLDHKYAKKIEGTIKRMQIDEKHTLNLLRNQTSIIDSTFNLIKKDESYVKKQFDDIYKILNNITQTFSVGADRSLAFNTLVIHINIIISDCRQTQNAIIDLLTDIQHGHINHLLITPDQLSEELHKIREHLPVNTVVPAKEGDTELLSLYQLMQIKGRLTADFLIIDINIPLLSLDQFELYAITPIPQRLNHSLIFIDSSMNYFGVSLHRDKYFPITEIQISKCINWFDDKYICTQTYPLFTRESTMNQCEIKLFLQENALKFCMMREVKSNEWWIQTHNPSQWLFSLANEIIVIVVCKDKSTQQTIKEQGVLRLNSTCSIHHQSLIIEARQIFENNVKTSVLSTINATMSFNFSNFHMINIHPRILNNSIDIFKISDAIEGLKDQQERATTLNEHDIHHYCITYGILAVLGVVFIIFWAKKWNRKLTPVQAARTNTRKDKMEEIPDDKFRFPDI